MIADTLKHLTDDGIMVVQFGELDFDEAAEPHRSLRDDRPRRDRVRSASRTRAGT